MALYDTRLEASAIASLCNAASLRLEDAKALVDSSDLTAEDFYSPAHRDVWAAVAALLAQNTPPTPETLHYALVASTDYAQAGGLPWLQKALLEETDYGAAFPANCATLKALAQRRAILNLARKAAQLAQDLTNDVGAIPPQLAGEFASLRASQAGLTTMEPDLAELLDDLQAAQAGQSTCLPTGIAIWDRLMGGLQAGVVTFVGAQPGVGKSALLGRQIINLAKRGARVGFFSLEDRPKWLSRRALSAATRIPVHTMATQKLSAWQMKEATNAAQDAFEWHRHIVRPPPGRMTPTQVATAARSMVINHGCQAIFLDHLGEIDAKTNRRDRFDLDVNEAIVALRDVALQHNVPVVVAAHFHRPRNSDAEPRFTRPTSTSWGETSYIERKARVAVGMWMKEEERGRVYATILKQTLGRPDVDFWMTFDATSSLVGSDGGDVETDERGYPKRGHDSDEAA